MREDTFENMVHIVQGQGRDLREYPKDNWPSLGENNDSTQFSPVRDSYVAEVHTPCIMVASG